VGRLTKWIWGFCGMEVSCFIRLKYN